MVSSRLRGIALVAVACALLVPVALAAASRRAATARVAACTTSHLEVWLGNGEGGGTAGRTYYPLEFTNVGRVSCTLYGYPGVSAWGLNGKQIGLPATTNGTAHSTVTITPAGTAHALLAFVDWGAVCSKGVSAYGLKVYPPDLRAAQMINYPLTVCASRSVLVTGPLRAGVGIPGYTGS
ncbi:MAG TPA: DUF4232 domain-containing protein [Solirubrobacteraceae bacterium]|jgi:hypothetical protein|nr:DUF4232 domain-containing protein [Solirubrobacteraceae bacterium]